MKVIKGMKKVRAVFKEAPRELLNDLPALQQMITDIGFDVYKQYDKLIIDNNLNPLEYHMAINITDQYEDDFVKDRIKILVCAEPNEELKGNYKDKLLLEGVKVFTIKTETT